MGFGGGTIQRIYTYIYIYIYICIYIYIERERGREGGREGGRERDIEYNIAATVLDTIFRTTPPCSCLRCRRPFAHGLGGVFDQARRFDRMFFQADASHCFQGAMYAQP